MIDKKITWFVNNNNTTSVGIITENNRLTDVDILNDYSEKSVQSFRVSNTWYCKIYQNGNTYQTEGVTFLQAMHKAWVKSTK